MKSQSVGETVLVRSSMIPEDEKTKMMNIIYAIRKCCMREGERGGSEEDNANELLGMCVCPSLSLSGSAG